MVSSGLSHRRMRIPRPKVCKPPPPPPPPPDGYQWPDAFPLLWTALWLWEEEEFGFSVWLNMEPITPGVLWTGHLEEDEEIWDATVEVDPDLRLGFLHGGFQGEGDETGCELVDWVPVWMVVTAYVITEWTVVYPFGAEHEFRFTF